VTEVSNGASLNDGEPGASRSLVSRLLSGGTWVLTGKVMTALSTVAIGALIARLLFLDDVGLYNLTHSIVFFSVVIAKLGLGQAVVRLVAESMSTNRPGRARAAVRWVLGFGLGGATVVFVLLAFGPGRWIVLRVFDKPALTAIIGVAALWAAVMALQNLVSETFRGFHDMRGAAVFGGAISGLLTAGVLALLWVVRGESTLLAIIAVSAGSIVVSLVVAAVVLRGKLRGLGEPEVLNPRAVADIAWPMLITTLTANALLQSDIFILGAFRSEAELAIYGMAARTVRMVAIPLMIVNLVVPPFVAELYSTGDRRRLMRMLRGTATLAGIPAVLVLMTFIVFGAPILGTLYAEEYRQGALVLAILSIGRLVNVWTGSCAVALSLTGHQKVLMKISLAASAVTITAVFLVVRPFGVEGVATAMSAGIIVQDLSIWIAARRLTGLWTHAGIPTRAELRELVQQIRASVRANRN
jgi:O-antigen/teichoic acid export membrane protein